MYEVEMKFRVTNIELFEEHLKTLGGELGPMVEEVDQFYQHPQRDFLVTDECLRLRRRRLPNGVEEKFLTYKGPKMDRETKTRREIEIRLGLEEPWELILDVLGFRATKEMVRKFRRCSELLISDQLVVVVLDFLPELEKRDGVGTFVELETIASESDWELKRELIINLSKEFGFSESVRTSYLDLLTRTVPPS